MPTVIYYHDWHQLDTRDGEPEDEDELVEVNGTEYEVDDVVWRGRYADVYLRDVEIEESKEETLEE